MRNFPFLLILILFHFNSFGQDFLYHIEPLNWWVDMNSPKFEILVHGDKVGEYDVDIFDERVKLIKTINLDNSNYIVLGIQILERSKAVNIGKIFKLGTTNNFDPVIKISLALSSILAKRNSAESTVLCK